MPASASAEACPASRAWPASQLRGPAITPMRRWPSRIRCAVMLRARAAGLHTQIFAYDHNWTEHPNDVAATPPDETADINAYPQNVLDSPAAKYVAGVAYHCYFGDPRDDHAAQPVPGQGDLLHRVLGQPVRRPG